ncbi:MAG: molybdenum cofactor biosynthesis protein B [Thermoanaerobaculia bacterium]
MGVEEHRAAAKTALGFAVLTVSDTRNRATDEGGALVAELAVAAGHRVVDRKIVLDEADAIRGAVASALADRATDVVIATGGTGLSPRDVTVEAVRPLFEREIEGFGELFRVNSWSEVGPAAMLSRATAGLARGKAIFLLPGSPKAVRLAMEKLILPEAGHLLAQARRAD